MFAFVYVHYCDCIVRTRRATMANQSAPGETAERGRQSVSGSLSALNRPHADSGRRYPFYWWKGTGGEPTQYAMKPHVAALFHAARQARADR